MKQVSVIVAVLAATWACSSNNDETADFEQDLTRSIRDSLLTDVDALRQASLDLQLAAPAPSDRGWDPTEDAIALQDMTEAWLEARSAYEQIEGALAPLFPDIDAAIDARYEDFLAEVGPNGDQNLFDGEGVTGMHAIERILFSATTPADVVTLEASLPGYSAAAFPATAEEALAFKNELCAKLVSDTQTLFDQWQPQRIAVADAFQGLISLVNEQREKVNKAASEEEESRYAQRTMADIRDNLAGTRKIYALFVPELVRDGEAIDADIQASFAALATAYARVDGDAFPPLPPTWSAENPTEADLTTPFGQLFAAVQNAVNPNRPGSAVDAMNRAATALGLTQFVEE